MDIRYETAASKNLAAQLTPGLCASLAVPINNAIKLRHHIPPEIFNTLRLELIKKYGYDIKPHVPKEQKKYTVTQHAITNVMKDVAIHICHAQMHGHPIRIVGPSAAELCSGKYRHCCLGNFEHRDMARISDAARLLNRKTMNHPELKLTDNYHKRVHTALNLGIGNETVCVKGATRCGAKATFLYFPHSLYDLSCEDVERLMVNAQCTKAFAIFLLPLALEGGRLNGTEDEVTWKTVGSKGERRDNYDQPQRGDRISFAFKDGTLGYSHAADNLLPWFWAAGYASKKQKNRFNVNLAFERQRIGNQVILTITASPGKLSLIHIRAPSYRRVLIPDVKHLLFMLGLSTTPGAVAYHDVCYDFYQKLINNGFARADKSWDLAMFRSYIVGNAVTLTIGGSRVFGIQSSDMEELTEDGSLSLFAHITARKREDKKTQALFDLALTNVEKNGWANRGVAKDIAHSIMDFCYTIKAVVETTHSGLRRVSNKLLHKTAKLHDKIESKLSEKGIIGTPNVTVQQALMDAGFDPRTGEVDAFHQVILNRVEKLRSRTPNLWFSPSFDASVRARALLEHDDFNLIKNNLCKKTFVWETLEAPAINNSFNVHYRGFKCLEEALPPSFEPSEPTNAPLKILVDEFIDRAFLEYRTVIVPAEMVFAKKALDIGTYAGDQQRLYKLMQENGEYISMLQNIQKPKISLISAGPGCGKTHHILHNLENNDIVIVPTRESLVGITAKFASLNEDWLNRGLPTKTNVKFFTPHLAAEFAVKCMTVQSHTIGKNLWVDEAFLQHPGIPILVGSLLKLNVTIVGDPRQITVKDFDIGDCEITTHSRWNEIVDWLIDDTIFLNDNYRNPTGIGAGINAAFGYNMEFKSSNVGEFHLAMIPNLESLKPKYPKAQFINLSQNLKDKLTETGYLSNTCHEIQSATRENAVWVITPEHIPKFNEDPGYMIVSMTRHTNSLEIYVVEGDYSSLKLPDAAAGSIMAFLDLTSPMSGGTFEKPMPRQTSNYFPIMPGISIPRTNMTDINSIDEIIGEFQLGGVDGPGDSFFHVAYKTNFNEPAAEVRIYNDSDSKLPEDVRYSKLSRLNHLQFQENDNLAFKLHSWLNRNANGRKIPARVPADDYATVCYDQIVETFMTSPPETLTYDELNEALVVFFKNVHDRNKTPKYAQITSSLFDLNKKDGFIKKQLKGQWEPTNADAYRSLHDAVYKDMPSVKGKAGQCVVAWSKARNVLDAAHMIASEKQFHKKLQPWVIYATDMSDVDLQVRLEEVMQTYKFMLAIKGDDVIIGHINNNGEWMYDYTDAGQFDTSFSNIHFSLSEKWDLAFGKEQTLAADRRRSMEKYNLHENTNLLRIIGILGGNTSGNMQTLSFNSKTSLAIIGQTFDWKNFDIAFPTVKYNTERANTVQELWGVELKHECSNAGSFVGFVLYAGQALPDIFRALVKTVDRRVYPDGTVDLMTKMELRNEGYKDNEIYIAKIVREQANALHDRLAGICNENRRETCIYANLAYYFPNLQSKYFYYKVETALNFLQTYAHRDFEEYFVGEYTKRIKTMKIHYYEDEPPAFKPYIAVPEIEVLELVRALEIDDRDRRAECLLERALAEQGDWESCEPEKKMTFNIGSNLLPFSRTEIKAIIPALREISPPNFKDEVTFCFPPKYRKMSKGKFTLDSLLLALSGALHAPLCSVEATFVSRAVPAAINRLIRDNVPKDIFSYVTSILAIDVGCGFMPSSAECKKLQDLSFHVTWLSISQSPELKYYLRFGAPCDDENQSIHCFGYHRDFVFDDKTQFITPPSAPPKPVHDFNKTTTVLKEIPDAVFCEWVENNALAWKNILELKNTRMLVSENMLTPGIVAKRIGCCIAAYYLDSFDWIQYNFSNSACAPFLVGVKEGGKYICKMMIKKKTDDSSDESDESSDDDDDEEFKHPFSQSQLGAASLDDAHYLPTNTEFSLLPKPVPQEQALSCFYAAAITSIKFYCDMNFSEKQLREMLANEDPEYAHIYANHREMAPYSAVDTLAACLGVLVIVNEENGWFWHGEDNTTHNRVYMHHRNMHWMALLPKTPNKILHKPRHVTFKEDKKKTSVANSKSENFDFSETRNLRAIINESVTHKRDLITACRRYTCFKADRIINRLRPLIGNIVPLFCLPESNFRVAILGDETAHLINFFCDFKGISIIDNYSKNIVKHSKVFNHSYDALTASPLPANLLIADFAKHPFSVVDLKKVAPLYIISAEITELKRDELCYVPELQSALSTRVYLTNIGEDQTRVPQALRNLINNWKLVVREPIQHFSNELVSMRESFEGKIQNLFYLDSNISVENVEKRADIWNGMNPDMTFSINKPDVYANVRVNFTDKSIFYDKDFFTIPETTEKAAEVQHHCPDDGWVFKHKGMTHIVLKKSVYNSDRHDVWQQNAADLGGPEGMPVPYYLTNVYPKLPRADPGDLSANPKRVYSSDFKIGNEHEYTIHTIESLDSPEPRYRPPNATNTSRLATIVERSEEPTGNEQSSDSGDSEPDFDGIEGIEFENSGNRECNQEN